MSNSIPSTALSDLLYLSLLGV